MFGGYTTKYYFKRRNKMKTLQKGFTLIELMIVIAIIGILAAIAILLMVLVMLVL